MVKIMPNAGARAQLFIVPLREAMVEFAIDSALRQASFLSQMAHETAELRYMREIADGSAYEGRADLGNIVAGDGQRFRGRGGLQATGRAMYEKLAAALGLPLITQPELLEQPGPAMRSAAWIWTVDKKLNALADQDLFGLITKRINGGYNGLDDRLKYFYRARKVYGL